MRELLGRIQFSLLGNRSRWNWVQKLLKFVPAHTPANRAMTRKAPSAHKYPTAVFRSICSLSDSRAPMASRAVSSSPMFRAVSKRCHTVRTSSICTCSISSAYIGVLTPPIITSTSMESTLPFIYSTSALSPLEISPTVIPMESLSLSLMNSFSKKP